MRRALFIIFILMASLVSATEFVVDGGENVGILVQDGELDFGNSNVILTGDSGTYAGVTITPVDAPVTAGTDENGNVLVNAGEDCTIIVTEGVSFIGKFYVFKDETFVYEPGKTFSLAGYNLWKEQWFFFDDSTFKIGTTNDLVIHDDNEQDFTMSGQEYDYGDKTYVIWKLPDGDKTPKLWISLEEGEEITLPNEVNVVTIPYGANEEENSASFTVGTVTYTISSTELVSVEYYIFDEATVYYGELSDGKVFIWTDDKNVQVNVQDPNSEDNTFVITGPVWDGDNIEFDGENLFYTAGSNVLEFDESITLDGHTITNNGADSKIKVYGTQGNIYIEFLDGDSTVVVTGPGGWTLTKPMGEYLLKEWVIPIGGVDVDQNEVVNLPTGDSFKFTQAGGFYWIDAETGEVNFDSGVEGEVEVTTGQGDVIKIPVGPGLDAKYQPETQKLSPGEQVNDPVEVIPRIGDIGFYFDGYDDFQIWGLTDDAEFELAGEVVSINQGDIMDLPINFDWLSASIAVNLKDEADVIVGGAGDDVLCSGSCVAVDADELSSFTVSEESDFSVSAGYPSFFIQAAGTVQSDGGLEFDYSDPETYGFGAAYLITKETGAFGAEYIKAKMKLVDTLPNFVIKVEDVTASAGDIISVSDMGYLIGEGWLRANQLVSDASYDVTLHFPSSDTGNGYEVYTATTNAQGEFELTQIDSTELGFVEEDYYEGSQHTEVVGTVSTTGATTKGTVEFCEKHVLDYNSDPIQIGGVTLTVFIGQVTAWVCSDGTIRMESDGNAAWKITDSLDNFDIDVGYESVGPGTGAWTPGEVPTDAGELGGENVNVDVTRAFDGLDLFSLLFGSKMLLSGNGNALFACAQEGDITVTNKPAETSLVSVRVVDAQTIPKMPEYWIFYDVNGIEVASGEFNSLDSVFFTTSGLNNCLFRADQPGTLEVVLGVGGMTLDVVPGEPLEYEFKTDGGIIIPDGDQDGLHDLEDDCPTVAGDVGYNGCPFADETTVDMVIIDRQRSGVCGYYHNGRPRVLCKEKVPDMPIKIFDRQDPEFVSAFSQYPSRHLLDNIYEADLGLVGECVTDENGQCLAGEDHAGKFLVIGKFSDEAEEISLYTAKFKNFKKKHSKHRWCDDDDDDDDEDDPDGYLKTLLKKKLHILKIINKDGSVKYRAGYATIVEGSLLEVIHLEYTIWEDETELYPFAFSTNETWEVDICANVPEGYELVGVEDENGTVVSTSECIQTMIADEEKIYYFDLLETSSPEPTMSFTFTATHNGEETVVETQIEGVRAWTEEQLEVEVDKRVKQIKAKSVTGISASAPGETGTAAEKQAEAEKVEQDAETTVIESGQSENYVGTLILAMALLVGVALFVQYTARRKKK